nr:immunoglobulin heavy chain junction region [Mus musculus]
SVQDLMITDALTS